MHRWVAKRGRDESETKKGFNGWEAGQDRGKAEVATKKGLSHQVRKGWIGNFGRAELATKMNGWVVKRGRKEGLSRQAVERYTPPHPKHYVPYDCPPHSTPTHPRVQLPGNAIAPPLTCSLLPRSYWLRWLLTQKVADSGNCWLRNLLTRVIADSGNCWLG